MTTPMAAAMWRPAGKLFIKAGCAVALGISAQVSCKLDAFKWLRSDKGLANANVYNMACYSTRERMCTTPPVVHMYSRARYNRSSAGRLLVCTRAPFKWLITVLSLSRAGVIRCRTTQRE